MKTWFALTSYWRATFDTEAPGTRVAATISRFYSAAIWVGTARQSG
jgi:hypothetical protein